MRVGARDAVVTGIGTTNPLGGDAASTWQALREGRCAVTSLPEGWAARWGVEALPVSVAAALAVDPAGLLTARELRRLDRASQCALIAAREAWAQAFPGSSTPTPAAAGPSSGQDPARGEAAGEAAQPRDEPAAAAQPQPGSRPDPERLAVVISPGMGPVLSVMEAWDTLRERGPRRVLPTSIPALMPNAPAATVGIELGARAGIHAPVSACASGAEAIAYGRELIGSGRADVVVAGGTDAALHPMTVAAFAAMHALSRRGEPTASRPFAPDRDGFVLGEGAGVVVLESAEHAASRGAQVLAVLAGASVRADAYDVARPDPAGTQQERALREAIAGAGLEPEDIGHVNAHATSTPAGDRVEAQVLARTVPGAAVSATKSATGHLLGGAGGLEAVLAVLTLVHGWMPPTLQPAGVDPEVAALGLDIVGAGGREATRLRAVASTSFGFGGHDVALVLRR